MIDLAVAASVLRSAVEPALAILPRHMDVPLARIMVMATGGQESGLVERVQRGGGPARSLWQFERGGGVAGVYKHRDTHEPLRIVCRERGCSFDPAAIYDRLAHDDVLGAACARLLLWTDPEPLPASDDIDGSWGYYLRLWRPGKPDQTRWPAAHAAAVAVVLGPDPSTPEDL